MTTDRHACGLSSILPMSCRGRAEAFARRLQSRLQSLGRQPSDDPHETEESWLTTSQQAFPTSRQPRLSSSSESDIYFDFDCDFGSPESPQEEATEAIHLNRRKECDCILERQDLESGCATASATVTATSPGSSDSSDNYYDPETPLNDDLSALIDSTLQRSCGHGQCNGFEPTCVDCGAGTSCFPLPEDLTVNGHPESQSHEPLSPCSSEPGTAATNETRNETLHTVGSPVGVDELDNAGLGRYCRRARKPRVDYTKCNGLRHEPSQKPTETHEMKTKPHEAEALTYETETKAHEGKALTQEAETNAHEVKALTQEAETNAHEVKALTQEAETNAHLVKALTHEAETSAHEAEALTQETETKAHETNREVLEVEAREHEARTQATGELEAEKHESETKAQDPEAETVESVVAAHETEVEGELHEKETNHNNNEYEKKTPEQQALTHEEEKKTEEEDAELKVAVQSSMESPLSPTPPVYKSSVLIHTTEESCDDTFMNSLNILKQELLVECPTVPDVEITEATPVSAEASSPTVPRKEVASSRLEVDDELEDDRPQRVRRCSSLKTGKTPPGTPGRKKIVRFADVLGLDLADVRTFLDEVPKVPHSAYDDLQDADLSLGSSSSISAMASLMGGSLPKPEKLLVALFVQPGGCADFLDRVREQQVCLENAVVSDAVLGTIAGTVRVRNLDFHKSVHVRYTVDDWKTFSDLQASYVPNSCDGFSDTFSFTMYAHTLGMGQRLEFAVRFQCQGFQYWDSNGGTNYAFQCLPPASQSPFRSQPMSTCPDEQWASFY